MIQRGNRKESLPGTLVILCNFGKSRSQYNPRKRLLSVKEDTEQLLSKRNAFRPSAIVTSSGKSTPSPFIFIPTLHCNTRTTTKGILPKLGRIYASPSLFERNPFQSRNHPTLHSVNNPLQSLSKRADCRFHTRNSGKTSKHQLLVPLTSGNSSHRNHHYHSFP